MDKQTLLHKEKEHSVISEWDSPQSLRTLKDAIIQSRSALSPDSSSCLCDWKPNGKWGQVLEQFAEQKGVNGHVIDFYIIKT